MYTSSACVDNVISTASSFLLCLLGHLPKNVLCSQKGGDERNQEFSISTFEIQALAKKRVCRDKLLMKVGRKKRN